MAALCYLLLPVTGVLGYFLGKRPRTRFHGLQAVALGLLWPLSLIAASEVSPTATRVALGVGAVVWIVLMGGAAVGKDLTVPGAGRWFRRWAEVSPRADLR